MKVSHGRRWGRRGRGGGSHGTREPYTRLGLTWEKMGKGVAEEWTYAGRSGGAGDVEVRTGLGCGTRG